LILLQGEDEEGETNELVNSVLDEIGIDLDGLMVPAPGQQTAIAEQPQVRGGSISAFGLAGSGSGSW